MNKLLSGKELEKRADELGVDKTGPLIKPAGGGKADDAELQRRVIEAERHIRESRLWVFALISAIASVISAIAAWVAVAVK